MYLAKVRIYLLQHIQFLDLKEQLEVVKIHSAQVEKERLITLLVSSRSCTI